MSRRKGRRYEQQVCRLLRAAFPGREVHRASQAERAREPDVSVAGVPIWFELEDARDPSPGDKMRQAVRDCAGTRWPTPVVVWHLTGARRSQATMRLPHLVLASVQLGAVPLVDFPGRDAALATVDLGDALALLRALYPG